MLGIWNTLLAGNADATWVFRQWEGCEAELRGVDLNVFPVCDYGMPYAYAPCLCAHPEWLEREPLTARKFLEATAAGYAAASADPSSAAEILVRLAKEENDGFEVDPALAQRSALKRQWRRCAAEVDSEERSPSLRERAAVNVTHGGRALAAPAPPPVAPAK